MEKIYGMHKLVGLQLFGSGTPTFSSGTPTFCQMGVLNSCFQNPSESSEKHPPRIILAHICKDTPRTNVSVIKCNFFYVKTATNASGTARPSSGFHTPDTCQIANKIIISGKLMYFII